MSPGKIPDIKRRLLALNEALTQLGRPEAADATRLTADPVLRAAVERWLQIAVEACLDLANNHIARNGWTPPGTGRAAFATLAAHGLLGPELATRLGRAVGLRNLLVHNYASVDIEVLAGIVRDDCQHLREFAYAASRWPGPPGA